MKYTGNLFRIGMILIPVIAAAVVPMAPHGFDVFASTPTGRALLADGQASPLARKRPTCDIGVSQSVSSDPVTVGYTFEYYIIVLNHGASTAAEVVVRDSIPAGTFFQYAFSTRGACTDTTGVLVCSLGSMAPGDSAVITLGLYPLTPGTIVNTASGVTSTIDSNLANNSFTRTITAVAPQAADLTVRQGHVPDSPVAGDNLAYTINVSNQGPTEAADVTMGQQLYGLPYTVVSASTNRGTCSADSGGSILCAFGTMAAGDSARVDVVVVPGIDGLLYSYVSVNSQTPDPDFSNNSAFDVTSVLFSAQHLIADLTALVESYRLRKGTELSLVSALQDAQSALAAHDTTAACSALDTFRQRVARFSGRGLTVVQAYQLDSGAAGIESLMHCGAAGAAMARAARLDPKQTQLSLRLISGLGEATQRVQLSLPVGGHVRLDVFDVSGRLVRTVLDGQLPAGGHEVGWDGRGAGGTRAPTGMYFLRVMAEKERAVARVLLLR